MNRPLARTPFAALLLLAFSPLGRGSDPPNIILVITDDQGYPALGCHGHPWLETPHIDALHERSVAFDRFLVSPTCAPTRAALMTGRHPMRNGVTHTILERERMALDATTLPEVLASAGYTSGIFGKWHLGDEAPYQPGSRGFDEVFIHGAGGIGQAYDCSCADAPDNGYFDPVVRRNGTFVKTSGFCTDVFFTAALGWIDQERRKDEPFFAYIATNAPHGPFIAPAEDRARFEAMGFPERAAGFYGMVENIDKNMGRLEEALTRWELHENTVLIFMSDNGMTPAGAGRGVLGRNPEGDEVSAYNAGMRGHKGSVHEGGVRVPFFVRWDGHTEPGLRVDTLAAHIDLLPTLADLAGIDRAAKGYPRDQVEGRSLAPVLLGTDEGSGEDRYLFNHRGRWPTGADPEEFKFKGCAVRNERFRLVDGEALFDMAVDPGQTTNVIDRHPGVVRAMAAAYDRWWDGTLPLMVNESVPMSKTRPFHVAYRAQQDGPGISEWRPPILGASLPDMFDFDERPEGGLQLVGELGHRMVAEGPGESNWTFEDGVLTAPTAWDSLLTPEPLADFRMHVEFNVNDAPENGRESNGNSGVYIQQRYEIQILNSHGVEAENYQVWDCGSLYRLKKPDRPACRPAGEWQSFDIVFRAARFEGERKVEDARITVLQNGVLIHDAVALARKTGAGEPEGPDPLPVKLQGHHNPVRFRNVWVEPLNLDSSFPTTPARLQAAMPR